MGGSRVSGRAPSGGLILLAWLTLIVWAVDALSFPVTIPRLVDLIERFAPDGVRLED